MGVVHIVNPAAGAGRAPKLCREKPGDTVYETKCTGDAERYARELCLREPDSHIVVYGGDGTVNEVVNGIMQAGAGKRARFSAMPAGTGNDFIREFEERSGEFPVDLIKYNGRYAVDMINIGFDCDVVARTASLKRLPLITGSFAYILGVASVLCGHMGAHRKITLTGSNGESETFEGEYLLTIVANAPYCGGGFNAASPAKPDDGLLDLMLVNKISRMKFIALVKYYRAGTHLDVEKCVPMPKFEKIITYRRFVRAKIEGLTRICADGEVSEVSQADIEVVPSAAVYFTYKPDLT